MHIKKNITLCKSPNKTYFSSVKYITDNYNRNLRIYFAPWPVHSTAVQLINILKNNSFSKGNLLNVFVKILKVFYVLIIKKPSYYSKILNV